MFDDISQIGKYRVGRVFGVGIGVGSRYFVFIGFDIFVRSMIGNTKLCHVRFSVYRKPWNPWHVFKF